MTTGGAGDLSPIHRVTLLLGAAECRQLQRRPFADRQADVSFLARDVTDGRADQAEEMSLDPFACEVVRNAEDECVVRQVVTLSLREPRAVRRLVESPLEPTGYLVPQGLRSQLD